MKISANDPLGRLKGMLGKLDEASDTGRVKGREKDGATTSQATRVDGNADGVSVSPQAQELRRLRESIDLSPDVRQELVDSVRAEIASGRYRIDGTKIADELLAEAREFNAASSTDRES
jgi:negative regulator of flagellin synthesis FlgM